MDLLIDASVLIAAERADAALGSLAPGASSVAISAVTVTELWQAVERADSAARRSHRAAACERIVTTLDVIDLDAATALIAAQLATDLDRAGTPLAPFRLLVAATAISQQRTLATFDRDVAVVPDLPLLDLSSA
jgi:tRNA(fMet)-specific endonuclease VapC